MSMHNLTIVEHSSPHYSPRTWHNATTADLTVAFAVDFTTAGEKLTRKAAGNNFVAIPLDTNAMEAADMVLHALTSRNGKVLNIAGNGIRTLAKHGWTQDRANAYLLAVLAYVKASTSIVQVQSGGQTGIDMSGAIAGVALDIPTVITMPKGCIQRYEDGVDRTFTPDQIRQQVQSALKTLKAALTEKPQAIATARDENDLEEAKARYRRAALDFLS
jgi:hypothetical protein